MPRLAPFADDVFLSSGLQVQVPSERSQATREASAGVAFPVLSKKPVFTILQSVVNSSVVLNSFTSGLDLSAQHLRLLTNHL